MALKSAIIHSDIILHLIDEESKVHEKAVKLIENLRELLIPSIVFLDVIEKAKKIKLRSEMLKIKLKDILHNPRLIFIPIQPEALSEALDKALALSSLTEYIVLYYARKYVKPIATFDVKLQAKARRLGLMVIC